MIVHFIRSYDLEIVDWENEKLIKQIDGVSEVGLHFIFA